MSVARAAPWRLQDEDRDQRPQERRGVETRRTASPSHRVSRNEAGAGARGGGWRLTPQQKCWAFGSPQFSLPTR